MSRDGVLRSLWRRTAAGVLVCGAAACAPRTAPSPVRYVDPLIGTGISTTPSALAHSLESNEPRGQTFPAVGVPFGMTSWTPQTRDGAAKCIPPYYHFDTRIQGFRASHWMSGSCTQDYGSVTVMPVSGALRVATEARASRFDRSSERATPTRYSVHLADHAVDAQITGASRAGLFSFTYRRDAPAYVVVNPNSHRGEAVVEIRPEAREIVGYNPVFRIYQGQGKSAGFAGHFVIRFREPLLELGVWRDSTTFPDSMRVRGDGRPAGAFVRLGARARQPVLVKVGTSFTSEAEARRNLEAELPGWSFDAVVARAEEAWGDALGTVAVEGGSEIERRLFYTALYHSMLLPRTFSDASGSYPSFAGGARTERAEGFTYYTDFSLWDTHRAVHPLLTILAPRRAGDMVRSLQAKAEQGGWLPIFPSWNSYTSAMIGDHATTVIADAYLKGIRGFDAERLYGAMRQNALALPADSAEYQDGKGRRALDSYLRLGFVPLEDTVPHAFHKREQVSRTLEYAYDDYAVAQLARALGKHDDHRRFLERSRNWRNVFDPRVGFVRGRWADGRWSTPFDPAERAAYITEGTSWQYTWSVPHDVAGLIGAMGGRERFIARLDTLFDGGHYWHGNEPNHHIAYLYAYAGAPWKTQARVREIIAAEYGDGPGGISGNDDTGQMSAWYAFSALGFYPVNPAGAFYVLGTPLFPRATLRLEGGRRFSVVAEGVSESSRYVQSARLNGRPLERAWITHAEIAAGGTLELRMGPEPNRAWASAPEGAPPSGDTPVP